MGSNISQLVSQLRSAESFEDAADCALGAVIDVARAALDASAFAKKGRILRAMVHHRPDDGYRRLVVVEGGADGAKSSVQFGEGQHLPSASAWQWVRSHHEAVTIDVTLQTVTFASGEKTKTNRPGEVVNAKGSMLRMLERDATHVLVVPIVAPLGRTDGMIVVEASCKAAIGQAFIWETCRDDVATIGALVSAYLARLPIARVSTTPPDEFLPVIGASMQPVVEMLRVFAKQEETILLSGPTGAGKSRLARWCHEKSPVKKGPFETIDLSSVPEELQLAELFGWRKGAFTSAVKDHEGGIARAEKGTLFIDEIDKLSLASQAGLLRVLEDKRYRQLGDSDGDKSANVRFIIGTNADLGKLCDEGKFRADLYYRINVLPVRIPPLKNRRDEVVDWAEYMLRRRNEVGGAGGEVSISSDAARLLSAQDWPGNLRQLDNIVRRAYALSQIEQDVPSAGITLRAEHLERALQYEGNPPPVTLLDHLMKSAEAFTREAERRFDSNMKLDLDLCTAFKGLVLESAMTRWPSDPNAVKRAFLLFGKDSTVKSRNHWAHFEREMKEVEKLKAFLAGRPLPPDNSPPSEPK
ncbi:MAG: sigma-54-dependent Fis family transcriptional regulator [Polyangiaceae bacterium]|nr:sigma-54-dependent Fis family transcriptional regulator [Polyangiaceae bacterium]